LFVEIYDQLYIFKHENIYSGSFDSNIKYSWFSILLFSRISVCNNLNPFSIFTSTLIGSLYNN